MTAAEHDPWVDFGDGYASGLEEGLTLGYLQGSREAWDRAWTMTVDLLGPEDWPRTTSPDPRGRTPLRVVPDLIPSRPMEYRTKAQTGPQILAQARWSWQRFEREIAEQTGRRSA